MKSADHRPASFARLALRVYDGVVTVIVWTVLVPYTLAQMLKRDATWADLRERLGRIALPRPLSVRIVVHAVSAGEMAAASAFIARRASAVERRRDVRDA